MKIEITVKVSEFGAIMRRFDALEAQGVRIMAKVVDLIAQGDTNREAILQAVSVETGEIAQILADQQAAFAQVLADALANGEFVTEEQMQAEADKGAAIVAAIQGISDALATPVP